MAVTSVRGPRAATSPGTNDPGPDRGRGAAKAQEGYSPMTAQRRPIMMKKPENMAMRPIPPYGEFAPS